MKPRHPIYIVSKGRWERRLTSTALALLGLPHYLVVEASEEARYREVTDPLATILVLDPRYQAEYDPCDRLGTSKSLGPGPARNFAWEHSIAAGASWHWVMDDNIRAFYRFHENRKVPVGDATIFAAMEDFVDRYENVGMAGPNYFMFASRKSKRTPFTPNTRIYSCNLIRNDLPFRWRGRYNEDTDLSLRLLKAGVATILFNAFLQYKLPTQEIRGGNTDAFYALEGTLPKSEMLVRLHPDVARLVSRYGRPHHQVDYRPFRNLVLRRRADIPTRDYGLRLQTFVEGEWR